MLLKFDIPILAVGGGGYNIKNTVRAWCLAWAALCGDDTAGHETLGLGGVMLQSTEWQGGLRDAPRLVDHATADKIVPIVEEVIDHVKKNVFKLHGL